MLTFQQWGLGSIPTLAAKNFSNLGYYFIFKQEKSMKIDSKKMKKKKNGENDFVSTTIVEQRNVLS